MAVQDLITEIYNKIPLGYFEMEYDYEVDNDNIDVRLYGASYGGAEVIAGIIDAFEFDGVDEVKVSEPTEEEVEYAFSGYEFVRVSIGVDRNVARGEKDHFFFNDMGRML